MRDAILAAAPFLVAAALLFGPTAAWLAARRHRNPALWLLFGALLGPVALALIGFAPPARCPACSEMTVGFERTCQTCGYPLRSPSRGAPLTGSESTPPTRSVAEPAASLPPPRLHAVPNPIRSLADRERDARALQSAAPPPSISVNDARPDRLTALGAHRPGPASAADADAFAESRPDLTILAIGVFVRGSESLVPGSRYLIARTADRLKVIGPIEASSEHVELDLSLARVEANFVPDRLVVGGIADERSGRTFILVFQGVAGLTATPVDEAIMENPPPISIAAGQP